MNPNGFRASHAGGRGGYGGGSPEGEREGWGYELELINSVTGV